MRFLKILDGPAPVVLIHMRFEWGGFLSTLLKGYGYNTTVFTFFNPRSTDTGGPRLCSSCSFLMVGTQAKEGTMFDRMFRHFNTTGPTPKERFNFFAFGWHSSDFCRIDATAINPSEKADWLLLHLFTLLGQPRGWILDLCAGSCGAILGAFVTNRSIVCIDSDRLQLENAATERQSLTSKDILEKEQQSYAKFYEGMTCGCAIL